ncbi:MAG: right-handed parallel beta-helix repeat-containing protein [Verrucomicrobiota bacterium]
MTLSEARKILGLAPAEDPSLHLAEFKDAREHIAAMVRTAPNENLAERYQKGLIEFDQAIAAVHEHLGASAVSEGTSIPAPPKTVVLGIALSAPQVAAAETAAEESVAAPRNRALSYFVWVLAFFIVAAVGALLYVKNEEGKRNQRLVQIATLERQGAHLIENRRWQDASNTFAQIELLSPGSDIASRGRRSIEAGLGEEQTQFIGYWTGQATAELDAGRLDEADAAARQVLARHPNEKDAAAILDKIAAARVGQSLTRKITSARDALNQRKWSLAISTAREVLTTAPSDPDAQAILSDAIAALKKSSADHEKAADLLNRAIARDQGQFDQQALDWLREARSLAPDNAEIAARFEKLSSYTRTLQVPGDFATPQEALENARDRDRIVLGAGTWTGPLVINVAVELQGAGFATTKLQCAPDSGSAITIGPDAKGARVSGISFRHESFVAGSERFSVALVRGGSATFVDCRFTDASGHGLAVIESGRANVSRSRFADNGWNGAAAIGTGSTLEVKDCESLNNFEHGIESWGGAAVILTNNRCEGNSGNGIHTDNGLASASIEGNQLIANREFGLVLDSASSGKISGNTARANLLGGIVIRKAGANLPVTLNQITLNQGPGLILERGLSPATYANNSVSQNAGTQILPDTDLSGEAKPAQTEVVPRATIVTEPKPVKPKERAATPPSR